MESVSRVNPWWYTKEWEEEDRNLAEWARQPLKWEPEWTEEVSLKPFSLNFLYGPRQVGKTTGVKLLVRKLLRRRRVEPQSLFYLDLDSMASLREFRDVLGELIREKEKRNVKTAYIFLDEVTSVEGWWRTVKFFVDSGDLSRDVVTVLGSSTLGLIKAPERFPGRVGGGKTVAVLPLSFPELLRAKGLQPDAGLKYRPSTLREAWEGYKTSGGFPRSVNTQPDAEQALISGLLSETYRHRRSPRLIQEISSSLISKIPSALSYNSIATDIGISHVTVREYIEFLSDLLFLGVAPLIRGDSIIHRRERKVFFRDPFALKAFSSWAVRKYLESALIEGVVQEHLYRRFGEIFYYRNHYEIDAVAGGLKLEVKAGKPHRTYPKGVRVLDEEDIPSLLVELSKKIDGGTVPSPQQNAP
jgi:predicted AAA+ superfamily ATPase